MVLLRFLNAPSGWYEQHPATARQDFVMGGRFTILRPTFSAMAETMLERLGENLATWKPTTGNLHTGMSGHGMWSSSTTALGKQFIAFIDTPEPLKTTA